MSDSDNDELDLHVTGYLAQKSTKKVWGKHIWKNRFFVLNPEKFTLSRYNSEAERTKKPLGVIRVDAITSVRHALLNKSNKARFDVHIEGHNRVLQLRAKDEFECNKWVQCLTEARRRCRRKYRRTDKVRKSKTVEVIKNYDSDEGGNEQDRGAATEASDDDVREIEKFPEMTAPASAARRAELLEMKKPLDIKKASNISEEPLNQDTADLEEGTKHQRQDSTTSEPPIPEETASQVHLSQENIAENDTKDNEDNRHSGRTNQKTKDDEDESIEKEEKEHKDKDRGSKDKEAETGETKDSPTQSFAVGAGVDVTTNRVLESPKMKKKAVIKAKSPVKSKPTVRSPSVGTSQDASGYLIRLNSPMEKMPLPGTQAAKDFQNNNVLWYQIKDDTLAYYTSHAHPHPQGFISLQNVARVELDEYESKNFKEKQQQKAQQIAKRRQKKRAERAARRAAAGADDDDADDSGIGTGPTSPKSDMGSDGSDVEVGMGNEFVPRKFHIYLVQEQEVWSFRVPEVEIIDARQWVDALNKARGAAVVAEKPAATEEAVANNFISSVNESDKPSTGCCNCVIS